MNWRDEAECLGSDPELFHSDRQRMADSKFKRVTELFCDRCDVRVECLTEGLKLRADGIWGGQFLTRKTRAKLHRTAA